MIAYSNQPQNKGDRRGGHLCSAYTTGLLLLTCKSWSEYSYDNMEMGINTSLIFFNTTYP